MKFSKILTCAAALCSTACFAAQHDDMVGDVYDFYNPNGTTVQLAVYANGDTDLGRVSLIQVQKVEVQPGDNGIESKYLKLNFYGGEDTRAFHMLQFAPVSRDKWQKYTIAFTPRYTGKVQVSFSPEWGTIVERCNYRELRWFDIAKVEATGTTSQVLNPLFDKNLQKSWSYKPDSDKRWEAKLKPIQQKDPTAPGGKYVRTCRDLAQLLSVKKDQMVTVSFYVRAHDLFKPRIFLK